MPRDREHFILQGLGKAEVFKAKGGGAPKRPNDVANRAAHAHALLHALDHLPNVAAESRPGLYLEVEGRPGEVMVTSGLDASGLTLLKVEPAAADQQPARATIFASENGIGKLRQKIEDFREKNRTKQDGSVGRPYNADLVQSIGAIVEAGLRALWRSPELKFPEGNDTRPWEIWLDKTDAADFIAGAPDYGVAISADRLEFPEDIVIIGTATNEALALAVRRLAGVRALAAPTVTADYFDALEIEEQVEWIDALAARTTFHDAADPNYITLLDRGVSRAHPLIAPALAVADRHAAEPGWGLDDLVGHGTQLAGLALFGDLAVALQTMNPIRVRHRLESAKIIPDAGHNPHHLLGAVTRAGINAVEGNGDRRRTFAMANTTEDDSPHDGAPTSWSSEIDQLTSGVSGEKKIKRLMLVSAGNTNQNLFGNDDYLSVCDQAEHEVESPAHAWNAICVGAFTDKNVLPQGEVGAALAPVGDLAPSSRTASWSSHWPLKPDVVFEGGNWLVDGAPPPMKHPSLSLLTTDHQFPLRAFTTTGETSGATALAARAATEIWSDYPDLWPETIRALLVSSARWTPQMRSHLPGNPAKGDYGPLFKRYGYGVPDLERARRSASNALTLVVQDTITPYRKADKPATQHVHNEMKLFELPWPVEELRKLVDAPVSLRVTLSTFIDPNPSEPARGSKFRYASHNLRFKLNRPNENQAAFLARISKAAEQPDGPVVEEDDNWTFGRNRRDVGSLHIDELVCPASDLARRNLLAIHPVAGWWKTKTVPDPENHSARFALIVEIDAGETNAELYAEVQAVIESLNVVAAAV
ncbi:S8 family peptidase [Aminobacter anthyllidis]|uniref:S8 family peptidase n=1 Tax=Aminobacter anthyllidis TaxID=1035067 RepID=UPI002457CF2E|nr:S8 family peptidase [Aminobacter anthyllidis]MDH4984011.1 S8 family peptidase [Aminobacter anthyllidis]